MLGITPDATIRDMARPRTKSQYPQAFLDMLADAGFKSPHAAAKAAGGADMLRDLARDKSRTLRADSLAALSAVLGRSVEEVSDALNLPNRVAPENLSRLPVRTASPTLAVRYQVQAGAWLEVDDMTQARIKGPPVAADDRFPAAAQWLELVRGDSVDLFFPDGSFVHVVDAIEIGYAPRDEDFVVVDRKREDGGLVERSLKQIVKKGRRVEFWPRSRNPNWQKPLDYATGAGEGALVEIAALVLGGYLPTRR